MTNPEYVRLTAPERHFSKKRLLQGELGILSMMKRRKEYERLRREELAMKLVLKKYVSEAFASAKVLDAVLPRIVVHKPARDANDSREEIRELAAEERSLEQEIAEIRRRLERLQ